MGPMNVRRTPPGTAEIQSFFREAARRQFQTVEIPPFTLFFHPADARPWLNYAAPEEPPGGGVREFLPRVEAAFHGRRRAPRFEFLDDFAPDLAPALRTAGYADEGRPRVMTLAPEELRTPRLPPGLTLRAVGPDGPAAMARRFLAFQRRLFGLGDPAAVTQMDADVFLAGLGEGRAFVARFDGRVVATGMFTHPVAGLSEVVGVATLEEFRRRGIGAAVTHAAAAASFARGASAVVLSAADEEAARMYARLGFNDAGALAVLSRPATAVTSPSGSSPVNSPPGGTPPKEGPA